MRGVSVKLSLDEMLYAAIAATRRMMNADANGYRHIAGMPDEKGWAAHLLGAAGEIAAARVLGQYWNGDPHAFKAADIGHRIQVRARLDSRADLPLRPGDNDEHIWVLVTGNPPNVTVVGWILGKDGMRPQYWLDIGNGRPPAWFVKQDFLNPLPIEFRPRREQATRDIDKPFGGLL